MDNLSDILLFSLMALPVEKTERFTSPASLVVDAILVIAFFCLLYWMVSPHVPSRDPKMIVFFGASCAACMSAVFWLAIQMFRVVNRAHRAANAARK